MELCWENLDKMYLTESGYLRKRIGGSHAYVYCDKCRTCGKPFLAARRYVKGKMCISNYCCISCSTTGRRHTQEVKNKISEASSGRKASDETRMKISEVRTGTKHTQASRNKMSLSHTGVKLSEEHRRNMIKSQTGEKSHFYKGGVTKLNIPLYDTYGKKLAVFEEVRIYMILVNGVVYKTFQVRCHNSSCRKWFRPTLINANHRLQAFSGTLRGEQNFYCSQDCKDTCSTYRKIKYRQDENPEQKNKPYTQPEYSLYRQTVLERENYVCEYCGKLATDVHHEQSKKEQLMLALDPDYGHACCEECHYKYGHKTGTECSTGSLAHKKCK